MDTATSSDTEILDALEPHEKCGHIRAGKAVCGADADYMVVLRCCGHHSFICADCLKRSYDNYGVLRCRPCGRRHTPPRQAFEQIIPIR